MLRTVTLDPDSILDQNSGSGSKFNVFGSTTLIVLLYSIHMLYNKWDHPSWLLWNSICCIMNGILLAGYYGTVYAV